MMKTGRFRFIIHLVFSEHDYLFLGRSYCVTSQKMLNVCMENLVLKVQTGVMVMLEKLGGDLSAPPLDEADTEEDHQIDRSNLKTGLNHHRLATLEVVVLV